MGIMAGTGDGRVGGDLLRRRIGSSESKSLLDLGFGFVVAEYDMPVSPWSSRLTFVLGFGISSYANSTDGRGGEGERGGDKTFSWRCFPL